MTNIITAIKEKVVQESSQEVYLGSPNSKHLKKIHNILNDTTTTEEDWFVCCVHASDNLVNGSWEKWHLDILKDMVKRTNGAMFILDHNWRYTESTIGFIFDGYLAKEETLPKKQTIGKEEYNQEIADGEGIYVYYAWVAIARDKQLVIDAIQKYRKQNVSTGGFVQKIRFICPVCTKQYNQEIGVYDRDKDGKFICPHQLPGYGWLYEDIENEMPYVEIKGDYDPVEISFVNSGNLPAACIKR
jgi:hypothetical protein